MNASTEAHMKSTPKCKSVVLQSEGDMFARYTYQRHTKPHRKRNDISNQPRRESHREYLSLNANTLDFAVNKQSNAWVMHHVIIFTFSRKELNFYSDICVQGTLVIFALAEIIQSFLHNICKPRHVTQGRLKI
uniref:Uncharacterized protein n=1 Tax=Glossina austeni TaxID=7395 RepID=A0A1A9VY77_GLOAU